MNLQYYCKEKLEADFLGLTVKGCSKTSLFFFTDLVGFQMTLCFNGMVLLSFLICHPSDTKLKLFMTESFKIFSHASVSFPLF